MPASPTIALGADRVPVRRRRRQVASALTIGALAAVALAHSATLGAMATQWLSQETYGHGLLVLPVCAWLAWRARHRLDGIPTNPDFVAALPLATLALGWLLADVASVNAAAQFALMGMLGTLVALVAGRRVARAFAFPIAFSLFAVPFGDFLVPVMMEQTADVTVWALRASAIPVLREGESFVIPSGRWSVVEACSGLRYLIASVCVGTLFAYLNFRSSRRRTAFVALCVVVPVLANWVRAYLIVMLGHLTDMRMAAGVDHLIYGWLFFGIVMLTLFAIGARWREAPGPTIAKAVPRVEASAAVPRPLAAALLAIAICVAPLGIARVVRSVQTPPPDLARLADAIRGASPERAAGSAWQPRYAGARDLRRFTIGGRDPAVDAYLAYFAQQSGEFEMIRHGNDVATADGRNGRIVARSQVVPADAHRAVVFDEWHLRGEAGDLLAWRAFVVGNTLHVDERAVKLETAWRTLRGLGDGNLLVVFSTPIRDGGEDDGLAAARRRLAAPAARLWRLLADAPVAHPPSGGR